MRKIPRPCVSSRDDSSVGLATLLGSNPFPRSSTWTTSEPSTSRKSNETDLFSAKTFPCWMALVPASMTA